MSDRRFVEQRTYAIQRLTEKHHQILREVSAGKRAREASQQLLKDVGAGFFGENVKIWHMCHIFADVPGKPMCSCSRT